VISIRSDGNVGIGTTSPTQKLHIHTGCLFITNTVANNPGTTSSASLWNQSGVGPTISGLQFAVQTNGTTERLRIDANGNVGIGTLTVSARLHINETTGTASGVNSGSIIIDHDNSGGASSITFRSKGNRGSDYGYIQYQDTSTVLGAGESAKLILGTQNDADDDILLLPSGGVAIATSAPNGYKLYVNGNTFINSSMTCSDGNITNLFNYKNITQPLIVSYVITVNGNPTGVVSNYKNFSNVIIYIGINNAFGTFLGQGITSSAAFAPGYMFNSGLSYYIPYFTNEAAGQTKVWIYNAANNTKVHVTEIWF
jgi:hypothetical protein